MLPLYLSVSTAALFAFLITRPRLEIRGGAPQAPAGCSEFQAMVSFFRPSIARGDDGKLHLARVRRNLLFAGYGWNDASGHQE